MARVKLQNVARTFDQVTAIKNITLDIPNGEFWVLVGPSGCGKSTVLRTIAGLESITEGEIYIGETLVNNIPARQRDVAMVFQNYALYPHLTVADNLAFGLRMRRQSQTEINRKVQTVARSLNIEHLLNRKPKQLSGGQQQRVALGRAIARQPKVFLLDEPLSNLDAQLRDDTRGELKQLHNQVGITTIYVTHDQTEAMTLADQIVVLEEGKVQQIGNPQTIYAQPANRMVATFLGNPPMNILPVTYFNGNFVIDNQSLPINSEIEQRLHPIEGQNFDLGIRPEDVQLVTTESHQDFCYPITVEIKVVEPLGREILIKSKLIDTNINLDFLVAADWQGQQGDRVTVQLNLKRSFIFDVSSGKTLFANFAY